MIDQNVKDILGVPGGFEKLTPGDTATEIYAGKTNFIDILLERFSVSIKASNAKLWKELF